MAEFSPFHHASTLYIGVMSGTSVDGIDVVIAHFGTSHPVLLHSQCTAFSDQITTQIERLIEHPTSINLDELGSLHTALGHAYADAILSALKTNDIRACDIAGIGCHGQTIRHQPNTTHPFSLQLGDANIIAEKTGITTVNDFRSRDIAAGGQGAPLVPSFHRAMFWDEAMHRAVVNIGGIANLTYLSNMSPILGFDVGAGNALMDWVCKEHFKCNFDQDGLLASKGTVNSALLASLQSDDFFKQKPPKSTGRELFNADWLAQHIRTSQNEHLPPHDLLATLTEFTAWGIVHALTDNQLLVDEIILCGGGAYNAHLRSRIQHIAQNIQPTTTVKISDDLGVPAQDVEAFAFAWLAMRTLNKQSNNCSAATRAKGDRILGAIHL